MLTYSEKTSSFFLDSFLTRCARRLTTLRPVWLPALFPVLLLTIHIVIPVSAFVEEQSLYVENEWNFVDMSMDISEGIPETASGRLARIRDTGKLTIATAPSYPPQEFIDNSLTGQARFVGSDIELARLIAERMGVDVEIVPLEFSQVLTTVADGKYDLAISALSFTSGRAAVLEMSKGYYFTSEQASSGLIILEKNAGDIRQLDDLTGKDIVAQSGSLQETMAAENITLYRKFRRLPAAGDVYEAVRTGQADAGVVDVGIARVYIEAHPDCGLMIVPDVFFSLPPQYEGDRVAAQKGEIELICFVNGVIDEVCESGIYDTWFEQYTRYNTEQS